MKKQEFLKILEKKLNVLEENEIKDTINEYSDIIDEKVKNGIKEEDAVLEFGDIESLTTEILKAYKINPNYSKSKVDDVINTSMNAIKEGSKKIEEITDNLIGNSNNTTELIIKIFLVILGFAIISIPFNILINTMSNLFNMSISPFNHILSFSFKLILTISYIGLLSFVIVALVKNISKKSDNTNKTKQQDIKEQNIKEQNIEMKKQEETTIKKESPSSFNTNISLLVKIFITIFVIVPFGFSVFGLSVASIVLFVLALTTHFFVGPFLIVLAMTFLFGYLLDIIYNVLYNNKKISIIPFFISIILFSVGITMTVKTCLKLDYIDSLPSNEYITEVITYERNYDDIEKYLDEDIKIEIDNELENDVVKFEVIYYKDFVKVNANYKDPLEVRIEKINIRYSEFKKLYNIFDENLKNYKIHNYKEFFTGKIKVYMNSYTYNK